MEKIRFIVDGRVQGVGFRYFVLRQAEHLNITGWVRNNMDGSVEILAKGEAVAVSDFLNCCLKGPLFSKVTSHLFKDLTQEDESSLETGFHILR